MTRPYISVRMHFFLSLHVILAIWKSFAEKKPNIQTKERTTKTKDKTNTFVVIVVFSVIYVAQDMRDCCLCVFQGICSLDWPRET